MSNVETNELPWWEQEGTIDLEERRARALKDRTPPKPIATGRITTLFETYESISQKDSSGESPKNSNSKERVPHYPDETHRVGGNQPIKVVGDFSLFTDSPVPLMRISGGKGKGPARYRALTSFGAHRDAIHRDYPKGTQLEAPTAHAVKSRKLAK